MTGRDRRALVLGSLLIGSAWFLLRTVPSLLAARAAIEQSIQQRTALLEAATRRLQQLPALGDSIGALERAAERLPGLMLAGEDPETAAVDLMRRSREILEAHAAVLDQFRGHQVLATRPPLTLVAVQVIVESDFRGIMEVADDIESDSSLSLEALSISSVAPHDSIPAMERLRAELLVGGWIRDPEATAESAVGFSR